MLSAASIQLLDDAFVSHEHYDIVKISFTNLPNIKTQIAAHKVPLVFTSKNGIYAAEVLGLEPHECYAISPVTSAVAEKAGYRVKSSGANSSILAHAIATNKESEIVHLTCADRRVELRNQLETFDIKMHEYEVYAKKSVGRTHENYDAILVFAPSHLRAFLEKNKLEKQWIFCIGKTTADFAKSLGFSKVKYCEISSENHLVELAINDMTNE